MKSNPNKGNYTEIEQLYSELVKIKEEYNQSFSKDNNGLSGNEFDNN